MHKKLKKTLKLEDIVVSPNVAPELAEDDRNQIGADVLNGFNYDKESRADWDRETEIALDLASLKREKKDWPWPNASNVKFPLITTASMQFAARTYPEIVRNGKVVEIKVVGQDLDGSKERRAKRVSEHMSYQLLIEGSEFETDVDKLLHQLPVVGTVFKKTYYDPVKGRNLSKLCMHDEVFIHNDVKDLDEARRVTHLFCLHKNDIVGMMRAGIYSDIPDEELTPGIEQVDKNRELFEILEQHAYLDLDDDGYEEPYIITVMKSSGKVLRIVARFDPEDVVKNDEDKIMSIHPIQYFTDFHFIPSPDGSFYSMGFGRLMLAINESVNTIYNQLIDSGTLANMQGGFLGKALRIKSGEIRMRPGRWHKLDSAGVGKIADQIAPMNYKEPSGVLFQLLGTLVDAGKELSSVNDAMNGTEKAQNVPATTILALIEQGTKVFSSIQRRMYRSLKKEFEKMYRLNRLFLDPELYAAVLDDPEADLEADYEGVSFDINPVADPHMSSDAQRMARSQAQLTLIGQPGINTHEVLRRYLEDLNTPNLDKILPPPDPNAPPPFEQIMQQHEMQIATREAEIKGQKADLQEKDVLIRAAKAEAEIERTKAEAIKFVAQAEAAELGQQLDVYKAHVDSLSQNIKVEAAKNDPTSKDDANGQPVPEEMIDGSGAIGPMGGGPGDEAGAQVPTDGTGVDV